MRKDGIKLRHKILIVEDEILERTALRKMLESNFPQTEVVGEASSGRQAIEYIELYHPDVITMDIRLPGMDGLQTIEEIKRSYPHISFIILSAFDTFSYAKKAISLGVHDYLLKPYDEEELYEVVKNVLTTRTRRTEERLAHLSVKDQMEQIKRLAETELVASLLLQSVSDIAPEILQEILNINFYDAAALNIYIKSEDHLPESEARNFYKLLKQELHTMPHCLLGPLQHNQLPIILYRSGAEQKILKYQVQLLWKQITRTLHSANVQASCGAGNEVSNTSYLISSYKEAVQASHRAIKNSELIYFSELSFEEEHPELMHWEEQIVDAFQAGEVKEAKTLLNQFFAAQLDNSLLSMKQKKVAVYDMLFLCSRVSSPPLLWNREIVDFVDHVPLQEESILQEFGELCRQRLKSLEEVQQNVVSDTLQYLKGNYQKDVSLETAAQRVHLSPPYLSKLFKETTGATFVDHLSQLRIKKAKEFLQTTNMSLKEICYAVGYHDPNYFSKVFRKYEDISPREFKQKHDKESLYFT